MLRIDQLAGLHQLRLRRRPPLHKPLPTHQLRAVTVLVMRSGMRPSNRTSCGHKGQWRIALVGRIVRLETGASRPNGLHVTRRGDAPGKVALHHAQSGRQVHLRSRLAYSGVPEGTVVFPEGARQAAVREGVDARLLVTSKARRCDVQSKASLGQGNEFGDLPSSGARCNTRRLECWRI